MNHGHPHQNLIALGVRQPWAELILRGEKTIEVRSRDTAIRGPIYLYASKRLADHPDARVAIEHFRLDRSALVLGRLIGTVEIIDTAACEPRDAAAACVSKDTLEGQFGWKLANPDRLKEPIVPQFLPYGVWFYPFQRRTRGQQK